MINNFFKKTEIIIFVLLSDFNCTKIYILLISRFKLVHGDYKFVLSFDYLYEFLIIFQRFVSFL